MREVREDPVAPADTGDKNVSARGLPLAEAFFCDRKWGYVTIHRGETQI